MALDRQTIEKKDFPISRRGYEPEAVDAHLAELASEVERLQKELDQKPREIRVETPGAPAPAPASASLAATASARVLAIVEAAEASAAEIEQTAQDDAARARSEARDEAAKARSEAREEAANLRAEAKADAQRARSEANVDAEKTRQDAVARSEQHVGQVGESTATMLQRVSAMESELGALIDSLRTGGNRLTADLSLLQGNMGELYGAAGGDPATVDQGSSPSSFSPPAPTPVAAPAPAVEEPVAEEEPEPEATPDPPALGLAPDPEPEAASTDGDSNGDARPAESGDVEGARLIALNMALNGQSREETDSYLRENFELSDRGALLDEVYATVEG